MKKSCKNYLVRFSVVTTTLATSWLSGAVAGCSGPAVPITVNNSHRELSNRYSRIDIEEKDLAEGLDRVFYQLSQRVGPFDADCLIKNYVPSIRKALYQNGFCRVKRLNLNGVTVDVDVYFRTDKAPATLTIETFIEGSPTPAFCLVNPYYVSVD